MKLHTLMFAGAMVAAGAVVAQDQAQPEIMEDRSTTPQQIETQDPTMGADQSMESDSMGMGTGQEQASQQFDEMDADRDGLISEDEANENEQLSGEFSNLDENEDGSLSADEFSTWEQDQSEPMQY